MRKIIILALGLLMMPCTYAQTQKEMNKERQQVVKQTKKELDAKVSKATKKEAKRLKKEKWLVAPGALPLAQQLERAYLMQYERDNDGNLKYFIGAGMSTGGNYDAARMQAMELARQDIAGQIQTEVAALIENSIANAQLTDGEAESLTRTVSASKNLISQSIGSIIPITEAYRDKKNKNKEVLIRVAYSQEMAMKAAKRTIRKELEDKAENLHDRLDKVLGF